MVMATGLALGVDIGGSGIKAALVNTDEGRLVTKRRRVATPSSLAPDDVLSAVVELAAEFSPADAPLGVGFPAVVVKGVPRTGFTAHEVEAWIGFDVAEHLARRSGRRVTLLNDADAAGLAEMRFGQGKGENGVVVILTLGTGIGSALFVEGRLLPNTELGTLYLRKRSRVAEWYAGPDVREREGLGWPEYSARLDDYLSHLERLLSPDLFVLGGGLSKRADRVIPRLSLQTPVVPAGLLNQAGIIGAAVAAAESLDTRPTR